MSKNQCDGCLQGLPVNSKGMHERQGQWPMVCEAGKYAEPDTVTIPRELAKKAVIATSALADNYDSREWVDWRDQAQAISDELRHYLDAASTTGTEKT